jgi:hypothetical protein
MIKFNEVTWYSKLAAGIVLLGVFPLLMFYVGMQYGIVYQQQKDIEQKSVVVTPAAPTPQSDTEITYTMEPTNDPEYTYPQITNFMDVVIAARVNQVLQQNFSQSGCGVERLDDTYEWDIRTNVDYARNDIFSVNASGNYFCGGAYPTNNYSVTLTFDMTTGKVVDFASLFNSYETDQEQILSTIYAAQITLAEMSADIAEEGSCSVVNSMETLLNYTHDYRLIGADNSLTIQPQYPHVIEACAESVTIPVEQLLPFSPTESLLYRI